MRDNSEAKLFERAYLLPGVLSTRLYLKRANRLAEHRITNIIEPLFTLLSAEGKVKYPHAELARAWELLLQNQPHDSICGCSVDEVHREMMVRTDSFNNILDALERRARLSLNDQSSSGHLSDNDPARNHNHLTIFNLSGQDQAYPVYMSWYSEEKDKKSPNVQIIKTEKRDELFSGPGITPYYKLLQYNEGWVWPGTVPGIGATSVPWSKGVPKLTDKVAGSNATSTADVKIITNELLTVEVSRDGGISAIAKDGQRYNLDHRLQDVGDGGDTYNFDPLPNDVPVEAKFISAKIGSKGPLVSSIILNYEIEIPDQVIQAPGDLEPNEIPQLSRSTKLVTHKIQTEVSVRKNVPIVFFETTWDNKSKDHRLEVLLNTGRAVKETLSENHFSLVKRQHKNEAFELPVEIGTEAPIDRFPCQRFFITNDQIFLNTGLPEYTVNGNNVAITLLRSVSLLSRGRMRTRGGGAGPHLPTPEANCLGPNKTSYAWAPLPNHTDAYNIAEQFEGRLWACLSQTPIKQLDMVRLNNQATRVISLHNDGNAPVLRVLNPTDQIQEIKLSGNLFKERVTACCLNGESKKEKNSSTLCVHPFELATARGLS